MFKNELLTSLVAYNLVNLRVIRRFALSTLKNDESRKLGIKNKRLLAAWDTDYLAKVLFV